MKKIIEIELKRAISKHPDYPGDVIHQAAIVAEEAGEVMQAALDLTYNCPHNESSARDHLYHELAQTAASCIRMMDAMEHDGTVRRPDA